MYKHRQGGSTPNSYLLYKPMLIIIISIIEAVMHDLHYRAKTFTREGIASLKSDILSYIQKKHLDKFEHYITSAQKHSLLGPDNSFYEELRIMRKLRNRTHIQNTEKNFEPNDSDAFSYARLLQAEKCLERVLKEFLMRYPRSEGRHHNGDFSLPWSAHWPELIHSESGPAQ